MKTYPRYFVGRLWSKCDAYLRFDSQHSCVWVKNDGKENPQPPGPEWNADTPDHTWDEVTFNEAEARLLPEARPLRWSTIKPDKAGMLAWRYSDSDSTAWRYSDSDSTSPEAIAMLSIADSQKTSAYGIEWCYLGPIPEILPPKTKRKQRLWIRRIATTSASQSEYAERWIEEDNSCSAGWIRTDETREVEQ